MVSIRNNLTTNINRPSIIKYGVVLICIFLVCFFRHYVFIPGTQNQQSLFLLTIGFLYKLSCFPIVNRKNWILYFFCSSFIFYILSIIFVIFIVIIGLLPFSTITMPIGFIILLFLDALSNFYILKYINVFIQISILVLCGISIYYISGILQQIAIAHHFGEDTKQTDIYPEILILTLSVVFAPVLTILYLRDHKKKLLMQENLIRSLEAGN